MNQHRKQTNHGYKTNITFKVEMLFWSASPEINKFSFHYFEIFSYCETYGTIIVYFP